METPRTADDSGAARAFPMPEKQPPPTGFQPRAQAPAPQRYPINNGSAGPRLGGGQPPPSLNRLDSRSTLGAPNAFNQARPPFGPPRAQTGQFPRGPPSNNQGAIRFPPPGARGPYSAGQRPQFNHNSQARPARPASADSGPRFAPPGFPYNPENQRQPRNVPETVLTGPGNPASISRQPESRPLTGKMETNGPNPPTANQANDKDASEALKTPKKQPTSQSDIVDDDDDVVIDTDKDAKSQSNESFPVSPAPKRTPTPEPRAPSVSKNEISENLIAEPRAPSAIKNEISSNSTPEPRAPSGTKNEIGLNSTPEPRPPSVTKNEISSNSTPEPRPPSVTKNEIGLNSTPEPRAPSVSKNEISSNSTPEPRPPSVSKNEISSNSTPEPRAPSVTKNEIGSNSTPEPRAPSVSKNEISSNSTPEPRAPSVTKNEIGSNSTPEPRAPSVTKNKVTPNSTPEPRPPSVTKNEIGLNSTPEPGPASVAKNEMSANSTPAASKAPTPVPLEAEERAKSRLSDNKSNLDNDVDNNEAESKSRASSAMSTRSAAQSPTKSVNRTLDLPSPIGSRSPEVKSPIIVGFDNGRQRSLSARSQSPISSPVTSSSPKTPGTPRSEKKAKFAEDEKEQSKTERSRPGTPAERSTAASPLKSPIKNLIKSPMKSPARLQTPKSAMSRSTSARSIKSDAGNESTATSEALQNGPPTTNGVSTSPTKKLPTKPKDADKPKTAAGSPIKSPSKSVKSLPRTPEAGPPSTADKKKVPMNKVQVGAAPSPNLKTVRSKIGSLDNASYKPGGGKVKIENRKLDFSKAQPKIAAKNDKYTPSGGDKKIQQVKLQWNAKPKVGSLDNATYKPGGGDKKIETVKLDFKDKAKPKVGSKDNAKHVPGGGAIKTSSPNNQPQENQEDIESQKIEIKAESKVGSLDNVKHKPGGGDKKIFNDRDYLRQTSSTPNVQSANGSGTQSPVPSNSFTDGNNGLATSDENLNQERIFPSYNPPLA